MDEIKVTVVKFSDRKYLQMQYKDPITGKKKTRSTGETTRRAAERVAAKWEAELQDGRYKPVSKITWAEFRRRYEDEVLTSLAEKTDALAGTVFNSVERILSPARLSDLTPSRLSHYQSQLRAGKKDHKTGKWTHRPLAEATIRSYLAHLKAALRWAAEVGMIARVPKVKMPKRVKGSKVMKGRAVTTEEFERMLAKADQALFDRKRGPGTNANATRPAISSERRIEVVASWQRLLNGLWLSGLRLGESLQLSWDDTASFAVDLQANRPMFRIRAEAEKGFRDRFLPMTPDFAEFLAATPAEERTGPVFKVLGIRGRLCHDLDWVSRTISRIGAEAGVKVDGDASSGKVKYASAHDLRRAFGHRWAQRVMPAVLKELMRHDDISTTMKYYAEQDAQSVADAVWKAAEAQGGGGNTSGNTAAERPSQQPR